MQLCMKNVILNYIQKSSALYLFLSIMSFKIKRPAIKQWEIATSSFVINPAVVIDCHSPYFK